MGLDPCGDLGVDPGTRKRCFFAWLGDTHLQKTFVKLNKQHLHFIWAKQMVTRYALLLWPILVEKYCNNCFQDFLGIPVRLPGASWAPETFPETISQMVPDPRWPQMIPNPGRSQMIPDDPRWSRMIYLGWRRWLQERREPIWSQIAETFPRDFPDDPRWPQMIPDNHRWSQKSKLNPQMTLS